MQRRGVQGDAVAIHLCPVDHVVLRRRDDLVEVRARVFEGTAVGQQGGAQFLFIFQIELQRHLFQRLSQLLEIAAQICKWWLRFSQLISTSS